MAIGSKKYTRKGRRGFWGIVCALTLFLSATTASAGVNFITEAEFQQLAQDLSRKVNLFRDVWARDPNAEFYGGTVRDYLFWLRGKFRTAASREEALKIASDLRAIPIINVRDFIKAESDIDIITEANIRFRGRSYGVRVIDVHTGELFREGTEDFINERLQGHIPAEKIRLSSRGISSPPDMGNGLREIYSGRLTLHLPTAEEFARSKYAQENANHPMLLVLRYLRLQALNFFEESGRAVPTQAEMLSRMDPPTQQAIREVVQSIADGQTLAPHFQNDRFSSWFNTTIQKGFQSNPEAMRELLATFNIDGLPRLYPSIQPMNQYLFQTNRDTALNERSLRQFQVNRREFLRSPQEYFADGFLYHGTRTDTAFRSIIFQGVMPSEGGNAGAGLYGVGNEFQEFSIDWGGSRERLVRFSVDPKARIVDISKGEGKKIWEKFVLSHGENYEKFCQMFGVDILVYPYQGHWAMVVKNSAVLRNGEGVYRKVLPLPQLLEYVRSVREPRELIELAALNSLNEEEENLMIRRSLVSAASIRAELSNPEKLRPILANLSDIGWDRLREAYQELPGFERALMKIAEGSDRPLAIRSLKLLLQRSTIARSASESFQAFLLRQAATGADALMEVVLWWKANRQAYPQFNEKFLDLLARQLRNPEAIQALEATTYGKLSVLLPEVEAHRGVMEALMSHLGNEALLGGDYQRRILDAYLNVLPEADAKSEAFLMQLLRLYRPESRAESSNLNEAIIRHVRSVLEATGFRRFNHAIVNLVADRNRTTSSSPLWSLLRKAETLSAEDTARLAELYSAETEADGMHAIARALQRRRIRPDVYSEIINRSLRDFAAVNGSAGGFDPWIMERLTEILRDTDFTLARIRPESLAAFAGARNALDSRADKSYAEIDAVLRRGSEPTRPLNSGGLVRRNRNPNMPERLRKAQVDHFIGRLSSSEGVYFHDNRELVDALLLDGSRQETRALITLLREGKSPFAISRFLTELIQDERGRSSLSQPALRSLRTAIEDFYRRHPDSMSRAAANYFPDLARELLAKNLLELAGQPSFALSGYVDVLRTNPELNARLLAYYRAYSTATINEDLLQVWPDFRPSREQIINTFSRQQHRTVYGLEGFFRNNERNTQILVAYAVREKDPDLVEAAIRLLPARPDLTLTNSAFEVWLRQNYLKPETVEVALRALPEARRQVLAEIAIRVRPAELVKFSAFFPLSAENKDYFSRRLQGMSPQNIDLNDYRLLLQSGVNPPVREEFYTADFINREVRSIIEQMRRNDGMASSRSESIFTLLLNQNADYRARVIRDAGKQSLSPQARAAIFANVGSDARLLINQSVWEALFRDPISFGEYGSSLAVQAGQDAELAQQAFRYAQAHPEVQPPFHVKNYIPEFKLERVRADLETLGSLDRAVEYMAISPDRVLELSANEQARLMPMLLGEQNLSKQARYLSAYLSFYNGVALEKAGPVLREMIADPEFRASRDATLRMFIDSGGTHSVERAALSLELIGFARAQGMNNRVNLEDLLVRRSFISPTQLQRESAEAYLAAAAARVLQSDFVAGGPEAQLIDELRAAAQKHADLLSENAKASLAALGRAPQAGAQRGTAALTLVVNNPAPAPSQSPTSSPTAPQGSPRAPAGTSNGATCASGYSGLGPRVAASPQR